VTEQVNGFKLFVSVMAGVKIEFLDTNLRKIVESPKVIRATPNTPSMVGCGCIVYSLSKGTKSIDTSHT
jgi:pyrroline-5-carboxylate reductase